MADAGREATRSEADPLHAARQFLALPRDVLVLSVAMLAFSLAFQMTSRYVPEYVRLLGAGAGVIGAYGTLSNLIGAVYPYPGGALSDRIGSRLALTAFGLVATSGFFLWYLAPDLGALTVGIVSIPPYVWVFVGLLLAQAWKSLGLGATFAIVKQSVPPEHLAAGFASTETFRRLGYLVGPLLAVVVLELSGDFVAGFRWILVVAVGVGLVATVVQHLRYDASGDSVGQSFEGVATVLRDLRELPDPLRPLLVGDTLVRFANGMVYVFFVIVVTEFLAVGATIGPISLDPAAFFGVLLAIEMTVALLSMLPVAKLAERTGLVPVVGLGFGVYAVFPALLIFAPPDPLVVSLLFAFSGLRYAGLPAHKALIVGPAEAEAGGRVTGTYYLVRNTIRIPSGLVGGLLYGIDPRIAFGLATVIGLLGTGYFLAFGREFEAYR